MVKIQSVQNIYDSIVRYYSKIQDEVNDFAPTSVAGGLIWSFATSIEEVYQIIEEVKKQAYIISAEGKYLDRLIYGTFSLPRNQEQRSSGYVVLYSTYPMQNPENVRLWCADYDEERDELFNTENSIKFMTSGTGSQSGLVFTLVAPKGGNLNVDTSTGQKYIDLRGRYSQFLVLPVVSMLKGRSTNIPEGAIRVLSNSIEGITGVINTYSPIASFFNSPNETPIQDRVTTILKYDSNEVKVVNATNFSGSGLFGIETFDGKVLTGYYQGRTKDVDRVVAEVILPVKVEYSQAYTKSILIDRSKFKPNGSNFSEIHQFKKIDQNGVEITYTLVDSWFGDRPVRDNVNQEINSIVRVINSVIDSTTLIIRQVQTDIDRTMIYDPDNVLSDSGVIIDSAQIGGGADLESDDAYRIKLRKYLASLGRATPTALEAGALTISGITNAVTLPSYLSPRGSATVLVSGSKGNVNTNQLYALKKLYDREWKAAGVNAIIKTPQKTEVTVLSKIAVKSGFPPSLIRPTVVHAIQNYFMDKQPGESISVGELMGVIHAVPGVLNVWSLYIGKKLTEDTYQNWVGTAKERNVYTETRAKSYGFKASLVRSMYNMYDRSYKLITTEEIKEGETANGEKDRYRVFQASKPNSPLNILSSDEFINSWNSLDYNYLQIIESKQDFENYLTSLAYSKLGENPIYEITRHLTEPLDYMDNIPLPINFEDIPTSIGVKPYMLEITEIPVVGTIQRNREIIPLIGIEVI